MTSREFYGDPNLLLIEALNVARKPTKLIKWEHGTCDSLPVTKKGGQPFWPDDIAKPVCRNAHPMTFIAQILLSDIPDREHDASLLSFHLCTSCNGLFNEEASRSERGYNFRVIAVSDEPISNSTTEYSTDHNSCIARLIEREEIMTNEDAQEGTLTFDYNTEDEREYPIFEEEFAQYNMPDLSTNGGSKLGGWPSWVQGVGWLSCPHGQPFVFVGQLAKDIVPNSPWQGGGVGYLWVCPETCSDRQGEISFQMT